VCGDGEDFVVDAVQVAADAGHAFTLRDAERVDLADAVAHGLHMLTDAGESFVHGVREITSGVRGGD